MKPKPNPKPKSRLARQTDRDYAATIVQLYRSGEPVMFRVTPEGRPVLMPMTGDDLAHKLERFAKHGTFWPASEGRKDVVALLRVRFRALRSADVSYEIAVERLAQEFHCSETTVRNAIKPDTQKGGAVLK